MGGHQAGQIASELALKTVFRAYYADRSPDIEEALKQAAAEANRYLLDVARMIPDRSGMGTTLTAAVVRDDEARIVQVGDSRCYLLRGGRMEQITEDHSWVQEQVRRGTMSLEDAEMSPFRNVITRSLGAAPDVEPDLFAIKLEPGDRLVLCSDGLSGMVGDVELFEIASVGSPSVAAWNLVDRAVEQGGKDNVTVLVLDVQSVEPWDGARHGLSRRAAPGVVTDLMSGSWAEEGAGASGAPSEEEPATLDLAAATEPGAPARRRASADGGWGAIVKGLFGR